MKKSSRISEYLRDDDDSEISGKSHAVHQAWKGAEAYHYYLLAHKQLYDGYLDAAMNTGIYYAIYST